MTTERLHIAGVDIRLAGQQADIAQVTAMLEAVAALINEGDVTPLLNLRLSQMEVQINPPKRGHYGNDLLARGRVIVARKE